MRHQPRAGADAVVVLKDGAAVTADALTDHCRRLIGGGKCPRRIAFRDEPLPTTPVGKIRKSQLRNPYWAGNTSRI